MPRKHGKGSPRTPKFRYCRDCGYRPAGKTISPSCSRCKGVMRVIR